MAADLMTSHPCAHETYSPGAGRLRIRARSIRSTVATEWERNAPRGLQ